MYEIYCLEVPISILIAVLIGKYLNRRLERRYKNLDQHCLKYLRRQLCKTYFCGYPVSEVYEKTFFVRYRHFVDFGFCYTTSALSMLALHRNFTSRLVYGEATWPEDGRKEKHRWCEFRYAGVWYVLDASWLSKLNVEPREGYYQFFKMRVIKTCPYTEFWSYPIVREFRRKLNRPETSYLFYELFIYLSAYSDERQFHDIIKTAHLKWSGEGVSYGFYLRDQGGKVLFSREIMDDFMKKPTRLRAKARSIRHALKMKRVWRKAVYGTSSAKAITPCRGTPLSADAIPSVSKCFT